MTTTLRLGFVRMLPHGALRLLLVASAYALLTAALR